ncbi:MAG: Asp-tRNA(Asn)/Glu-tRNA(Gln) amidotransferase subunit GatA [Clostridia bacterium]|nr:Asp-tRNA(Asn)/Glu-tRNA(Gln) amidotransferase subunit GatA [Clostridia bacterium]
MDITSLTIHELKDMLLKKEITSYELTKAYIDRIKKLDPKINAYITVCEESALAKAKEIDDKIDKGEKLGALAGIPIGIKDNICIKDIKTTCASKMLENFVAPYSATVIEKLNAEDAIIIGKLNMDEFAMGGSTERSAFFITKNPWDFTKVPGGSSGGSAAAVSADLATAALGSDTGGSIRQPASFCSLVGLKTTYGLVSRYGLVAFASSLDQIGPLTKDVTDCALVLNCLTGKDDKDTTSANIEKIDYTQYLKADIKGLKIGMPKEYMGEGLQTDVKNAVLEAKKVFESLGAIVEECTIPVTQYLLPTYYILACAEASSNLGRFDGIRYGYRTPNYETLKELYTKSRSEGFGPEVKRRILLGTYVLSSGYYDAYYKQAQKVRTIAINQFKELFEKYDVLLTPTSPITAFEIGSKTDDPVAMYLADICTVSINIAGVPAISIPCGFDSNKLPIGMQLIGNHFDEKTLIQFAYTYEQNTSWYKNKPELEV